MMHRRTFLATTGRGVLGAAIGLSSGRRVAAALADDNRRQPQVLLPQNRVPLSFVIDDSTCLVNMGHFCMPQFAAAWPDRPIYQKPWHTWPREIPDAFVRQFGEWCKEHGVKGKYSVVPYPALVGWLDRELPGWSRRQLLESLKLVRELMVPDWDIHPEMITHTRVINLATGRPFEGISLATMENSYPREDKSVDELAAYLAYALQILKNCDLPCEGITTPGGFGNRVKSELSLAVQQAVRDVYGAELPHYFKYISGGEESAEPKLEHVSGADTESPTLTVNVPAGTGDWFGGWDGAVPSEGFRYANEGATSGRMVELIERGEPAVMLCHWPGMYCNGTKEGFDDFKKVVLALEGRYADRTLWMKMSEIARYWAAKELTRIASRPEGGFQFDAPFASDRFTVRLPVPHPSNPRLTVTRATRPLHRARSMRDLSPGKWVADGETTIVCFDLPKGRSRVEM